jgi:16S rRNA G966 N2-methylase RsmD
MRLAYDRSLLLGGPKRNAVLTLQEVQRYGVDSFGDPDYVSLYGLSPADWYARGVRILGRTAVECTRDRLADLIARDVAEVVAQVGSNQRAVVIDPFAGSCNTLYWLHRHLPTSRAVGFELDDRVFEATHRNLTLLGLALEIEHVDHETGIRAMQVHETELLVAFIAPPWGDALSEASGLDLRRTTPPVTSIIDLLATTFPRRPIVTATQVFEIVETDSLSELQSRFAWSTVQTYDINVPGRLHGVLLGTI